MRQELMFRTCHPQLSAPINLFLLPKHLVLDLDTLLHFFSLLKKNKALSMK